MCEYHIIISVLSAYSPFYEYLFTLVVLSKLTHTSGIFIMFCLLVPEFDNFYVIKVFVLTEEYDNVSYNTKSTEGLHASVNLDRSYY